MDRSHPLADAGLDIILAPFRESVGSAILSVEDEAGVVLASSADGTDADGRPDAGRETFPIVLGGAVIGRVVVRGGSPDPALLRATGSGLAAALATVVERTARERHAASAAATRRIDSELAHGRQLQRSFVSLVAPVTPGYDLASHYEAAREVGGDFFDLFRLRRRGRPLSVVIADVTGKGIAAALLMAFSRPLLHAAIDHTTGPAEALVRTNRILVEERRSSLFITAMVARLDLPTGHLRFANAGHEPPIYVPGDGRPASLVLGSGPLVGAFADLAVPEVAVGLRPGDALLLYTDGVTDARSPAGERFEEARLFAAIESARGGSAQDLVDAVAGAVAAFAGVSEPADDITIVAIRRRREGEAG
ncbi:MAG: PP2C family protein-serine/threonine phosphatase [Candidatus Limnocylindria bacterium]